MAVRTELAVPRGTDPARLSRDLNGARERFLTTGSAGPAVRRLVAESWQRSIASGVDPETGLAPIRALDARLAEVRARHPLTSVMPLIRRLLVEDAAEAGLLVAVSDAAGQLLYVEGAPALRTMAEEMHFMAGADWSEAAAGTNAPGTALALDRPVQIFAAEHLSRPVTPWSCSAAPIHDPDTHAVLGVLDVTGGPDVVAPHGLALVRATVAAVEAELRVARLEARTGSGLPAGRAPRRGPAARGGGAPAEEAPGFAVLGRSGGVLTHGATTTRLSLRHSEILLLLAMSRDGLTAGELAVGLSDADLAAVTVRAEVSRLRHLLGPLDLDSRPYRLTGPLATDVAVVRDAVRRASLREAVTAYPGPVLACSGAPAVEQCRADLHHELRSALLASTEVDALLSFADTAHGHDDYELWCHVLDVLPAASPRRTQVQTHVAELDLALT